jgi:hypothetical protein
VLSGSLQAGQTVAPELLDVLAHPAERFGPRTVQAVVAVSTLRDQPGLAQDAEVLGDGWSADVEVRGDIARSALVVMDEAEDLAASRICDSAQHSVHDSI